MAPRKSETSLCDKSIQYMQRDIVIKTYKEAEVSVEELYKLEQVAFRQWTDKGL